MNSVNLLNLDILPYKKLWKQVLHQACKDLYKREERDQIKQNANELHTLSAKNWFSKDDNIEIGSFRWICDFLDLDYKKSRKQIFNGYNSNKQKCITREV